ncbi:MAG: acyl-CoA dehydrogenase [Sulfuricaulis sp.]|nr:acyl-CoA dehydrogenase [Sulfuricaulis sp.]
MDFLIREEQQLLVDSLRKFIESRYTFANRRVVARKQSGFDQDVWSALADMGIQGLTLPAEYGGFGENAHSQLLVYKELGRGLVTGPLIPSAVMAATLLQACDNGETKEVWLPGMASGQKIVVPAYQEVRGRYNLDQVQTRAMVSETGVEICGAKQLVWAGGAAHAFIVSARMAGSEQFGLFLVERDRAGVHVVDYPTMNGDGAADIRLESVRLPRSSMIRSGPGALEWLQYAIDQGIAPLCAHAVGAMERLIEITIEFIKNRHQFKKPLASFQALQHRIADMLVQKELALSMAYVAADAVSVGETEQAQKMLSAAKIMCANAGRFIGQQAVQLHGGMGMTDELEVGDYFKHMTMLDVLFGDTDFHLTRYSRLMENA